MLSCLFLWQLGLQDKGSLWTAESGRGRGDGKPAPHPSNAPSIVVTEDVIRTAMEDAPLQTQQFAVSMPVIQSYVDRILSGETDIPPIKVDGNIIVDGNHRYISSRTTNTPVSTTPWNDDNTDKVDSWMDIILDIFDWGNR